MGVETKQPTDNKKLVTMAASQEWIDWLGRLSDHVGLSRSATIDQAARRLAAETGFPEKTPKR